MDLQILRIPLEKESDDKARLRQLLPPTAQRVFLRTDPLCNAEIRNQTIRNLRFYKNCDKDEITERIRALNLEWDTERVLEVNAALLTILSSYLGIKTSKFWIFLTGVVGIFLLQHALHGWCPPLPFIRKWGVRTESEINDEKTALKVLRRDFAKEFTTVEELLENVEKK